uniref:Nucleotidyltransferase n=1 Tax=Meloidogyne hapla TaxID=6305 RepID=A0A1I8BKR3_MELHA
IVLNSKAKKEAIEKAKSHLWFYIECVDGFFIQTKNKNVNKIVDMKEFKGLFYLNEGANPLAISENYKNLLRSFMLTKPLYIATSIYKALKENDIHSLLEIVSTQKLEDLKLALKLINVLYPKFNLIKLDFKTSKVDFKKFAKNQKEFDKEKLEQFLNWCLDPNCMEKPLIEKVTALSS